MTRQRNKQNGHLRRDVLKGAGAVASASAVIGCDPGDGGPDAEFRDEECVGGTPMSPDELLGGIDHIVVLMMENRSFDHMFGSLSLIEGNKDVNGLTGDETNPGPDGQDVGIFRLDTRKRLGHLPHKWEPMHDAFNGGKNDGFVMAHHEANKEHPEVFSEVMGILHREDAPVMYALADEYSLLDQYHCSVMGPTWPNRFFMHAASSGGRTTNKPRPFLKSIWGALDDADVRGVNYFGDLPWAAAAMFKLTGYSRLKTFFKHCQEDRLPPFSIIDPGFFMSTSDHPREFGGDSDHPDMAPNVNLGQLLISTIYAALANSPAWGRTMFLITYDESGGFYDHVPPPTTVDERDKFRQMGFRIPGLVIGGQIRSGCVNHNLFEHSSIAATATRKWGLEPLNERVMASNDFSSCIHPDLIDNPRAPIALPKVTINEDDLVQKFTPVNTQPELWLAAENGDIPGHLDGRGEMVQTVRDLIGQAREYDLVVDQLKVNQG